MTKGELAKNIFQSGRNCAQSVALAFKDELGLTEEQISNLIIGFGGGFGRQRLVCGAVSGMVMVLGYMLSDGKDSLSIYNIVQKACAEFKLELGSLICAELLDGINNDTNPKPEARTKEYYEKRPCADICQVAANIVDKYLKL
ncbi:MAG: C_GCAxxG_C_C family protein [Clostridia bacterium]|nr:C_GCAxxG_C_C family protein [Clostridia bacterium]